MSNHLQTKKYSPISRALHWLMGLFILCMFALGWGREYVGFDLKPVLMAAHILIGFMILGLLMPRILARIMYPAPSLAGSKAYRFVVSGAHAFLYTGIICMPVTGWLYLSARGGEVSVFNIFNVPHLIDKNRQIAVFAKEFHEIFAYLFAAAILTHIAAALYHHFFKRDDVLKKMLP